MPHVHRGGVREEMNLYIASTSGYSGKTLVALGLAKIWAAGGTRVGYVKPLGKIPVLEDGRLVDGDAYFLAKELGLPGPPEDICPVVITQDRVMAAYRREPLSLRAEVDRAVRKAASRADVLLLGGAANLRDGLLLGLSPLDIIESAGARVLLVDRFAGEPSMDQILWAKRILGKTLLGVVLNRVMPAQEPFVREVVLPYLDAEGIRVFGAIPVDAVMESVSVATIAENLSAEVECAKGHLDNMIERFCVGAMDVENALRVFRRIPRKAVVTGGMRADIQHAALETDTRCLVLTGGIPPHDVVRQRADWMGTPILVTSEDTLTVVERLEQLVGGLRIRERVKIERGVGLIEQHVDSPALLAALLSGGEAKG